MDGPRDWFEWHRPYDAPGSDLAGRLRAVQGQVARALDEAGPGLFRVASLCAGQGRDLLGVAARHPRGADVVARLVEMDPRNAEVATAAARAAGLDRVEVVVGDASTTSAWTGAVPADLLLVCGVFGHATPEDIGNTIRRLPMLCAPNATVVWTRGRLEADIRPAIRAWFAEAGFEELGFESGGTHDWGVGADRLAVPPVPFEPGVRLFTFLG